MTPLKKKNEQFETLNTTKCISFYLTYNKYLNTASIEI